MMARWVRSLASCITKLCTHLPSIELQRYTLATIDKQGRKWKANYPHELRWERVVKSLFVVVVGLVNFARGSKRRKKSVYSPTYFLYRQGFEVLPWVQCLRHFLCSVHQDVTVHRGSLKVTVSWITVDNKSTVRSLLPWHDTLLAL